jgi:hypothetical protein
MDRIKGYGAILSAQGKSAFSEAARGVLYVPVCFNVPYPKTVITNEWFPKISQQYAGGVADKMASTFDAEESPDRR